MDVVKLVFVGTGGGRFATLTQKRRTGGIRFLSKDYNIHMDPGPGALIYSLNMGLDPQKFTAIFVSHSHPDHYTNAEILVEAMTHGNAKKKGDSSCIPKRLTRKPGMRTFNFQVSSANAQKNY